MLRNEPLGFWICTGCIIRSLFVPVFIHLLCLACRGGIREIRWKWWHLWPSFEDRSHNNSVRLERFRFGGLGRSRRPGKPSKLEFEVQVVYHLHLPFDDGECVRFWRSSSYSFFVSVDDLNRTFASSAPAVASTQIEQNFQVPKEVSYLITTTFLLGYVVGVSIVILMVNFLMSQNFSQFSGVQEVNKSAEDPSSLFQWPRILYFT